MLKHSSLRVIPVSQIKTIISRFFAVREMKRRVAKIQDPAKYMDRSFILPIFNFNGSIFQNEGYDFRLATEKYDPSNL